jgi:methylated-DNA-protein-cysteine methyltransferase-like protein
MELQTFTEQVVEIIQSIPVGRISTYGDIAREAGKPRAARQVARILHSCSEKEKLPWWRVVNRKGQIALKPGYGFEEQESLLLEEDIEVDRSGKIDLERYLWDSV